MNDCYELLKLAVSYIYCITEGLVLKLQRFKLL